MPKSQPLQNNTPPDNDPNRGFATPEIAAAWDEEIARRIAELDKNPDSAIPWPVVRRRLQQIIQRAKRRQNLRRR